MVQSRHWCFTLNNYSEEEDNTLRALGEAELFIDYLVLGYEVETHPHIQGYVIFKTKKRMSEAKNFLGDRCHLEKKRGSVEQASAYCKKDGLFAEFGSIPRGPGGQSVADKFKDWILCYEADHGFAPSERDVAQGPFHNMCLCRRDLSNYISLICSRPQLMRPDDQVLRGWQHDLFETIQGPPPDDRSILFYVDADGGQGKTWFQRYCLSTMPDKCQVLSVGKRDDIAHAIDESKSIFMFNIPRNGMEYFQYTIVEQLKDRMVFSPKYASRLKLIATNPHVIVFANEHPDLNKMTVDRYIIDDFSTNGDTIPTVIATTVSGVTN